MILSSQLTQLLLILIFTSAITSWILSKLLLKLATKYKIVDDPKLEPHRKKQPTPVPLLGGTGFALVCSFLMGIVWLINKFNWFGLTEELGKNLEPFRLIWILVAILILILGGFLDDKYKLSAKYQLIFINTAIILAMFAGGLQIKAISPSFNQYIPDIPYIFEIITYLWLLFCTGATKFLDGHDGLVSSVGIIALLSIASVSLFEHIDQPLVFIFAMIWIFGIIGFLPFNFPNARLYLGEGGSWIIGFVIGVLAILSGAKIATASSVLGWFVIDLVFVWGLRLLDGRNPFSSGDRLHWHFRLVDLGVNKVSVLVFTSLIITITAQSALLIQTDYKPFLLLGQLVFIIIIFSITETLRQKRLAKN